MDVHMPEEDIRSSAATDRAVGRVSPGPGVWRDAGSSDRLPAKPPCPVRSGNLRFRRWGAVGAGAALLLLIAWAAAYLSDSGNPAAPHFRPWNAQNIPRYRDLSYRNLDQRPFEGGTVWLQLLGGSPGYRSLLFDLESGAVLGELVGGGPEQFNADRTLLLCGQRTLAISSPVLTGLQDLANAIGSVWRMVGLTPPGLLRTSRPAGSLDQEDYWALDLRTGEATYLGQIMERSGTGSMFHPSPDLRFALKMPNTEAPPARDTAYLVDMASRTLRPIHLRGWPIGWWDSTSALVWSSTEGLLMVNVMTGSHTLLLSSASIAAFLEQAELSLSTTVRAGYHVKEEATPFVSWNGREYDVYFTVGNRRWSAEESFLLNYERASGHLRLVSPRFKFEWSDHFDESMQNYLYSGRRAGDHSDGVFLRDLDTGHDLTLVEPQGTRRFSIPHFYQDRVLYVRSNELWSVQRDGTEPKQVFPP